jgi:hypothetical protein
MTCAMKARIIVSVSNIIPERLTRFPFSDEVKDEWSYTHTSTLFIAW